MFKRNFLKVVVFVVSSVWVFQACTYEKIPSPNNCSNAPSIELTSVIGTDCGVTNGAISVVGVGGTEPYTFSIEGIGENTDGNFDKLLAGTYLVTVEDVTGCTADLEAIVKNEDGLNITVETAVSACGSSTGSISVFPVGGTEPYQFSIDALNFQNENEFEQLSPGEYTVFAKDAGGCDITQTVNVKSDAAFSQVKSIITTNCAVSNCHDGSISPDFRNDGNIEQRANRIKSRTSAKSMPPSSSGRSLSADEIQKIACWVDDEANS